VRRGTAEGGDVKWDELLNAVAGGGACRASAVGGELTGEQVKELLAVAPSEQNSRKLVTNADFSGLTFVGPVSFRNIRFIGDVSFAGASFKGDAEFVLLETGRCSFKHANFDSRLYAHGWKADNIDFEHATFANLARFIELKAGDLSFSGSTFKGRTAFSDVQVSMFFNFVATSFSERVRDFLAGCRFLHLQDSRLERGGLFHLHSGQVNLSRAELGASTMIAGTRKSGQFHTLDKSLIFDDCDWRPRLLAIEGTDVEKLVLQDVNLSKCHFDGSINLDKLRLEGLCVFDEPPKGLHVGADPPFLWSWTRRLSIFEERIWRGHSGKGHGWKPRLRKRKPGEPVIVSARGDPFGGPTPARHERQAQAEQLAKTYRALRKGREEAKNEPGAGDFYYGEMEMRRAGNTTLGERFVLWLYWLLSGYGLRPLRTSLALLVLVGLASWLLMRHGFTGASTYERAFLASLAASVNLEYLPPEAFTLGGHWIRIALKILGPTLFGVLLLALWGRVKR
jgi:uncharacterized protein YjbI with pentapeptide repeats